MRMVIKMIRYGILSTASIVGRFIAGIKESQAGEVYAITSRTVAKAKEAALQYDIKNYYGSYEELYEDENIDVIYIPTVNGLHYRDCQNALLHHKHVIVEKPFTLTSIEAQKLFDLAKQNQCFLMEAQKCVFLPTTLQLKKLIEQNVIGDIRYIELKAGFPGRFDYDHWMYDLSMGGGALYGSATYTIELMQFLFDNPHFQIDGSCIKCPTGSDEICNFQLKMNHQILVSSTIAMNVPLKNEAVFYGDKGYIVIPNYWKSNHLDIYFHNGETKHYDFPYQSEFVYEINHIHECLKQQLLTSPIMTPARTMEATHLVETLYQKWQEDTNE